MSRSYVSQGILVLVLSFSLLQAKSEALAGSRLPTPSPQAIVDSEPQLSRFGCQRPLMSATDRRRCIDVCARAFELDRAGFRRCLSGITSSGTSR